MNVVADTASHSEGRIGVDLVNLVEPLQEIEQASPCIHG
jgi:hypothetical protein